jgi:hypothetical protein
MGRHQSRGILFPRQIFSRSKLRLGSHFHLVVSAHRERAGERSGGRRTNGRARRENLLRKWHWQGLRAKGYEAGDVACIERAKNNKGSLKCHLSMKLCGERTGGLRLRRERLVQCGQKERRKRRMGFSLGLPCQQKVSGNGCAPRNGFEVVI